MGSSASKAGNASSSGAKAAQRHFPSAAGLMNEKAKDASAAAATAAAAAVRARAATTGATTANTTPSSPKQDYLAKQQQLEEELQKLDEKLKDSDKRAGESRPVEDTPSAAQLQFFGNLNTIGQVNVPNPDQIKHHEAEEILRKKMPTKSLGGPAFTQSTPIISSSASTGSASSETKAATGSSASRQSNEVPPFTPLVLMQILQLRNRDPSIWTEARLSEEFGMARKDIMALTKYINTYTIVPGKDAKGRESGVWCEDIRKVETLEKPSSVTDAEAAAAEASGGNAAASRSSSMAKTAVPSSNSKEAKKSKTA